MIYLLALYIFLKTLLVETKHDMYIILGGDKFYERYWKPYGALMVATELIVICVLSGLYTGALRALILFPVLGVVYSITHDCGMSYRLTGGIFHLGDSGWDRMVQKIFISGEMWLTFKVIWLVILVGFYFYL